VSETGVVQCSAKTLIDSTLVGSIPTVIVAVFIGARIIVVVDDDVFIFGNW